MHFLAKLQVLVTVAILASSSSLRSIQKTLLDHDLDLNHILNSGLHDYLILFLMPFAKVREHCRGLLVRDAQVAILPLKLL
jgi:hypothetical protein